MAKIVFLVSLGLFFVCGVLALLNPLSSLWENLVVLSVWGMLGSAVAVIGSGWQQQQFEKHKEEWSRLAEKEDLVKRVEQIEGIDSSEQQELMARIERLGDREDT